MSKLLGRLDWWRIQRLAFLVELIWAWFQFVFMALWSMSLLRLDPPLTMSSIEPFHRLFVNKILLFYFPFSEFLLSFSLFSLFTYVWHLACSFCIFVFIFFNESHCKVFYFKFIFVCFSTSPFIWSTASLYPPMWSFSSLLSLLHSRQRELKKRKTEPRIIKKREKSRCFFEKPWEIVHHKTLKISSTKKSTT